MRRYWSERADACRKAGLCIRCRKVKVGQGEAMCGGCKLKRKLRAVLNG